MLSFKPDNREPIFFLGAGAEVFYYWLITAPSKAVKANDENNLSQEMEPEGFQTSATLGIGLVGQGLLVRAIWLRWLLSFCVHLPSGTLSRLWHNKKMFLPKVLAATCRYLFLYVAVSSQWWMCRCSGCCCTCCWTGRTPTSRSWRRMRRPRSSPTTTSSPIQVRRQETTNLNS